MYVCVYMLVRVFLCVCACMCARPYVGLCVCVCLCVHVHARGVRRALLSPESESQSLSLACRRNIDALAAQMGKLQRARPGNTP